MNRLELLIRQWERKANTHNPNYAAGIKSCISDLKTTMPFIKLKEEEPPDTRADEEKYYPKENKT